MMSRFVLCVVIVFVLLDVLVSGEVVNFKHQGGIPFRSSLDICNSNRDLLNSLLGKLQAGDTLLIPRGVYWLNGGVRAEYLRDITIQVEGELKFQNHRKDWPADDSGNVQECIMFEGIDGLTFTSNGKGTINGNGWRWWGAINYLVKQENRPRLVHIHNSSSILVEYMLFKDSPYWTFDAEDVSDVVIRYSDVDARRTKLDYHDLFDMTAFNTDGFDISGKNVHIHDCNIWNDDDCIAVKEMRSNGIRATCSENMLFERINASGVGLTVGSIGASAQHTCVRNITFRDSTMHNTFKGIYLKSRPSGSDSDTGEIRDVLYENIEIYNPTQWAIWIGPQQATYDGACSLVWPRVPGSKCPVPQNMDWSNIVLRNIAIHNPKTSPGVILGNPDNPMQGVRFENVTVVNPGTWPWKDDFYKCVGVQGVATAGTDPVPPCFVTEAILQ